MMNQKHTHVCPSAFAFGLDNSFRRLFHKPRKILEPYVRKDMTVLDLGCGPGYFTTELAKLVGKGGKVIAADLQEGMLDKVRAKIRGTYLEQVVELHKCQEDRIGISQKIDFAFAFWMVHEVPDQERMFSELKSVIKPGGSLFIVEPKIHVPLKSFESMVLLAEKTGFVLTGRFEAAFSRSVLLKS